MALVFAAGFGLLSGMAALFQLALAAGMPWGKLAMGGRFPGRLPALMRVVCLLQAAVLGLLATIVCARAGMPAPASIAQAPQMIWGVVAFSLLSTGANLATPSRPERLLWAPVAVLLTVCSTAVALG
jgi:hypothetical protein